MFDPDQLPAFTTEQVCHAAEVAPTTFRGWVFRDPPVITLGQHEGETVRRGQTLRMSLRRALHVALTARLMRWMPAHDAAKAAAWFALFGTPGGVTWGDGPDHEGRRPGTLFPDGKTLLVIKAEADTFVPTVINAFPDTYASEILGAETLVIDVAPIYWRVRQRLGLAPA
jgi:hypothetical protein